VYQFNSCQLTYRYRIYEGDRWIADRVRRCNSLQLNTFETRFVRTLSKSWNYLQREF